LAGIRGATDKARNGIAQWFFINEKTINAV